MRPKTLNFPIPEDLRRRLEFHSECTGAPMAVLTRRALARYLDWLDRQEKRGVRGVNEE
jgi:hypothetical protein